MKITISRVGFLAGGSPQQVAEALSSDAYDPAQEGKAGCDSGCESLWMTNQSSYVYTIWL
jgi:hypothetical protein